MAVRDSRNSGRRFFTAVFAVALALLVPACSAPGGRAFYYWKTASAPGEADVGILDRLSVGKVYVHVFDIDRFGAFVGVQRAPAASIKKSVGARPLVPVVYIDNRCFGGENPREEKMAGALVGLLSQGGWAFCPEVEIDCDWSPATRDRYFAFLGDLRTLLSGRVSTLSVTLRLHQLRDRTANGIPPVSRCMLMAYNVANPADPETVSAILDLDILKGYLHSAHDYPLPLDVALPIWSWVSQFEGSNFLGLITDPLAPDALRSGPFRKLPNGRYEATASCVLAGKTVEVGDIFVVDSSTVAKTLAAAHSIAVSLKREERTIALFHLDAATIEAFSPSDVGSVQQIFTAFDE